MNDRAVIVYGLASSEDGRLRYIGQTAIGLNGRLKHHIAYSKRNKTPVHKWIFSLRKSGHKLLAWVISPKAIWNETEIETIKQYRELGYNLLNVTDGGEGTLGFYHTGRKRPDLAERNRQNTGKPGRKLSDEENEALQQYRKAKKPYVSKRNSETKIWTGKKHKEESRQKIANYFANLSNEEKIKWRERSSKLHKGRVVSDDTRRKISLARRMHEDGKTLS